MKIYWCSRGDHIVPNFEEIWPSKKGKDGKAKRPTRGIEYYLDAMENGPDLSGKLKSNHWCFLFNCNLLIKMSWIFIMHQTFWNNRETSPEAQWICGTFVNIQLTVVGIRIHSHLWCWISCRLPSHPTQLHDCWQAPNHCEPVRLPTGRVFRWHPWGDEGGAVGHAEPRPGG